MAKIINHTNHFVNQICLLTTFSKMLISENTLKDFSMYRFIRFFFLKGTSCFINTMEVTKPSVNGEMNEVHFQKLCLKKSHWDVFGFNASCLLGSVQKNVIATGILCWRNIAYTFTQKITGHLI